MCIILIEALTPLNRISCVKMYKNIARSRFFCKIAKRFFVYCSQAMLKMKQTLKEKVLAMCMNFFNMLKRIYNVFYLSENTVNPLINVQRT